MSRGSKLSRMVSYFKEADLDEADYVLGRALSIVGERKALVEGPKKPKPVVKRRRKPVATPDVVADEPPQVVQTN